MLTELLKTTNLFELLHRIDIDLTDQQQKAGCPFCGGSLHYSNYQRQPRGGPDLPEELSTRFSFCCSRENCRRRTLPKSTLFMDRRVYFRVVILIVTTLNQSKPQEYSKNILSKTTSLLKMQKEAGWQAARWLCQQLCFMAAKATF
jgi:hypothetical protein